MTIRRSVTAVLAAGTLAAAGALATAPAANASHAPAPAAKALGTTSLAAVLTAGKVGFDRNPRDYDIVTAAVLAVLKAKPDSPVKVLADGTTPVTAFIPNDNAFRLLVKSLTGKMLAKEKDVFNRVAGLGIDTVETVLLYHVVPGATITSKQAVKANGATLTTAQGGTIFVRVKGTIRLVDKDPNATNARVIFSQVDINKGNRQIAHGIDRVLRPVDLPPTAG